MNDDNKLYLNTTRAIKTLMEDVRLDRELYLHEIIERAGDLVALLSQHRNFLKALGEAKNADYPYSYTHPVNVAIIAYFTSRWLKFELQDQFNVVLVALLHDIGKAKIPDSIINKPGKLTKEEYNLIKVHPLNSFKTLVGSRELAGTIILSTLTHHERIDGSGYPLGLKGQDIHIYARVIAVADIFDAMTSDKAYSTKRSPFKVAEEIATSSFGNLDPHICQVFLNNMTSNYPGSTVVLSNDMVGEIVYVNPNHPNKPMVKCGLEYIDLANSELEIVDFIP